MSYALLAQGVACAVTGPIWGNLVDSGASRKLLLKVRVLGPLGTLGVSREFRFGLVFGFRALVVGGRFVGRLCGCSLACQILAVWGCGVSVVSVRRPSTLRALRGWCRLSTFCGRGGHRPMGALHLSSGDALLAFGLSEWVGAGGCLLFFLHCCH